MPNWTDIENRYSHKEIDDLKRTPEGVKDLSHWAHELACHRIDAFRANPPEDGNLVLSTMGSDVHPGDHRAFAYLDHIPDTVSKLLGVRFIALVNTNVSNLAPLANLRSLRELRLSHTPIADLWPLGQLPSLRELRIAYTSVCDLSPLGHLTSLRDLSIGGTSVTSLAPLVRLTALEQLKLTNTRVSDLSPLGQLTSLRGLFSSNTRVTDLSPLAQLPSLGHLHLENTSVSDLSPIRQLNSILRLWLDNTSIADLSPVAGLSGLRFVDFSSIPALDDDPELKRISEIEGSGDRARELLKYLNSDEYSPPSPPTPRPSNPPADLLRYAPVQPEFVDGMLCAAPRLRGGSEDNYRRDAWGVIRDSLKMLVARLEGMNHPELHDAVQLLVSTVGEDFATFRDVAFYVALKAFKSGSAPFVDRLTPETFARIQQIIDSGEFYVARSEACQKWIVALQGAEAKKLEEMVTTATDLVGIIESHSSIFDDRVRATAETLEQNLLKAIQREQTEDRDRSILAATGSLYKIAKEAHRALERINELTERVRELDERSTQKELPDTLQLIEDPIVKGLLGDGAWGSGLTATERLLEYIRSGDASELATSLLNVAREISEKASTRFTTLGF